MISKNKKSHWIYSFLSYQEFVCCVSCFIILTQNLRFKASHIIQIKVFKSQQFHSSKSFIADKHLHAPFPLICFSHNPQILQQSTTTKSLSSNPNPTQLFFLHRLHPTSLKQWQIIRPNCLIFQKSFSTSSLHSII